MNTPAAALAMNTGIPFCVSNVFGTGAVRCSLMTWKVRMKMEPSNNAFNELFGVNVNGHTEKKKSGNTELTYLSWPFAWAEVKTVAATYYCCFRACSAEGFVADCIGQRRRCWRMPMQEAS